MMIMGPFSTHLCCCLCVLALTFILVHLKRIQYENQMPQMHFLSLELISESQETLEFGCIIALLSTQGCNVFLRVPDPLNLT